MLNQKDKQLHFIAGLMIAFLFSPVISPFYALILAISAGLAKEIYDYFFQGNVEFMDFVVTLIGGLVGPSLLGFLGLKYNLIFKEE